MVDPVLSPFVGFAMAIPGLANLIHQLLERWKIFLGAMKTAERDGELLATRFDHLTQRYISLQAVLFDENKFDFIPGRVFDHLPSDQQNVLSRMFLELARILYAFLKLGQSRNISFLKSMEQEDPFDVTLSPDQVAALFEDQSAVPRHGDPRLKLAWGNFAWAVSNKQHVENLISQYENWLKRIRETVEDFWWPQSFFEKFSNMQALELDKDFRMSGMMAHSRLRKLLLDDSPFQPTFELIGPPGRLKNLSDTSLALRKTAYLDGQEVLVEIMPFKVDKGGFMPAELRRRFCTIAALLNTEDVDELRVLRCLHWREVREYDGSVLKTTFQLISALPVGLGKEFKTLKEVVRLLRGERKPSLDVRLKMCHVLAQTICQCLSVGWRHRSIRSENVLFFFQDIINTRGAALKTPFLCGFEESRLDDDYSMNQHGDDSIESNIYRHPERWGTPKAKFNAYHDLYCA
jgi:hypothetical protein